MRSNGSLAISACAPKVERAAHQIDLAPKKAIDQGVDDAPG
jgi:hypothetical protein